MDVNQIILVAAHFFSITTLDMVRLFNNDKKVDMHLKQIYKKWGLNVK